MNLGRNADSDSLSSYRALGINTKSKIRKQLQSPASWTLATPPASNPVLSTSNMRGVSEGLPAISFLRFSQKRHLIFFLQLRGEQLISQLLPVFHAVDPQDGPVRSRVYRAKTHSRAGRFALFSAYRQASSPLVSPAFWCSAVQRRHKLNPTSERDK